MILTIKVIRFSKKEKNEHGLEQSGKLTGRGKTRADFLTPQTQNEI